MPPTPTALPSLIRTPATSPNIMTTTAPNDALQHMLLTMDWETERIDILRQQLTTLNQLRSTKVEVLQEVCVNLQLNVGEYSELVLARTWYMDWKKSTQRTTIINNFTSDGWNTYIDLSLEASVPDPIATSNNNGNTAAATMNLVNLNYKVEAKEYPKLPKNTNLKGSVFNDWHNVFTVKLKQAQVGALLDPIHWLCPIRSITTTHQSR